MCELTLHRFFVTTSLPGSGTPSWPLPLPEGGPHHLTTVLRMSPGDRVMVSDPTGREAEALLRTVSREEITADIGTVATRAPMPRVALAQGLARRERMELVIQKATELGASEIMPVAFARSIVRLAQERSEKRTDRWRRIAEEAAKQAQRCDVPAVHETADIGGLVEFAAGFDVVLVPWEQAVGAAEKLPGIGEALETARAGALTTVLVVVGPEGGLEPGEVSALRQAVGAIPVSLGDTILRTETAAVVALSLAVYELGGLGGRPRG